MEDLVEETAEELAVNAQEYSEEIEKTIANTDGDPCNSYEWSILFLLILMAAVTAMCFHVWTLWKRRSSLSAYDILFVAFFFAAAVQFGPMMSQVLHSGHGVYHFSQSGCKLLFFTDYGMRHVIAYLVLAFFAHAYLVVFHSFDEDNLDGRMRASVPWFIISIFVVEGIFGMVPAIYVDVGPKSLQSCVWTSTMSLSMAQIVSMEIMLRPITPYLLPMLLLSYPLVRMTLVVKSMDQTKARSTLKSILVIVWSYFALNLPYAILLVAESVGHITRDKGISWMTVCNLKWVFFLMHQAWFLAVPLAAMALDAERGNKPPGSDLALDVWTKVKTQMEDSRKRIA